MTAEITPDAVSSSLRYEFRGAGNVEISVERAPGRPPLKAGVKLLDISQHGVKLAASPCLEIHEIVVLRIGILELQQEFFLPARVRWRQPARGNTWRVGCAFTRDLPADLLGELAVLGHIDRRRERRQVVDVGARARWELAEDTFAVRIVSVSPSGFCLSCRQAGRIGERLLLLLDGGEAAPVEVYAKAAWDKAAANGRCLIGCALATRADYELLCSFLQLTPERGLADAHCPRSRTILRWAALLAAVLLMLLVAYSRWR
jgi:hypothetical protein